MGHIAKKQLGLELNQHNSKCSQINPMFPVPALKKMYLHQRVVEAHKRLLADPLYKSAKEIIAEEKYKAARGW